MKIISWNVNGIRAILAREFIPLIKKIDGDIFCIQETKAHPEQVDMQLVQYPHHFWSTPTAKKGYAGTALFSKIKPKNVTYGVGIKEHDQEGRVITAEFNTFFLVNAYVPNSGRGLPRLEYRKTWDHDFVAYLKKIGGKKPVIVCGDFNVAHTEKDLANPKSNYNKTAGFTQVEIDGFEMLLKAGFIDSFREFVKDTGHYTFWSYMFNARKKNIGWRIDYFLISKVLRPKLKKAFILPDAMGSDHCPVGIEIDLLNNLFEYS